MKNDENGSHQASDELKSTFALNPFTQNQKMEMVKKWIKT